MEYHISRDDSLGMDACDHMYIPITPLYIEKRQREDNRLTNWKRWMHIRREQHKNLFRLTRRRQEELLMNSAEKYEFRTIKEVQECIQYAKEKVPPEPCGIDYYVSPQKERELRKRLIVKPEKPCHKMTYVDVPKAIRQEKDLAGDVERTFQPTPSLLKSVAMYNIRAELAYELQIVEQHRPDLKNLVIVGKSILPKVPRKKPVKSETPRRKIYVTEVASAQKRDENPVIMLKVDDTILGENVQEEFITPPKNNWHYVFDTKLNCVQMCQTRFQNMSDIIITISWNRFNLVDHPMMKPQIYKSNFFFDKNEIMLMPGQTTVFSFWFCSSERGCFQETWELITRPCVISSEERILFYLFGSASDYITTKCLRQLEEEIDRRTTLKIAEDLANEMTRNIDVPLPLAEPLYKEFFYEKDVFLIQNRYYFYDSVVVHHLMDLYYKLMEMNPDNAAHKGLPDSVDEEPEVPPWDYSINTIRSMIVNIPATKLRFQYYNEFTNLIEQLKIAKPKYKRPDEKYTQAYSILCKFANSIDTDAINLKRTYNLNPVPLILSQPSTESRTPSKQRMKAATKKRASPKSSTSKVDSADSPNFSINVIKSANESSTMDSSFAVSEEGINPKQVQQYKDALYLRVYSNFAAAVEAIAAAVDSCNRIK